MFNVCKFHIETFAFPNDFLYILISGVRRGPQPPETKKERKKVEKEGKNWKRKKKRKKKEKRNKEEEKGREKENKIAEIR